MSEPIVEQIAEWLISAIAQISTANGYQQSLSVARPGDLEATDTPIADLTTIVGLEDPEHGEAPTQEHRLWVQPFGIITFLVGDGGTEVSIDKRINRVRADIEKRLGAEIAGYRGAKSLCNHLADWIELRGAEIWLDAENQATVLLNRVAIRYHVDFTDPYTQSRTHLL